ncbi:restriction endonuclease subunit S [Candidatus Thiothrix anitrata]|uniref:Restriction endonuclease subunit S n=1 Tax=Candidatus Thiothrix anitrata TaxID=2823902 RepID=A0ABX7X6M4_9GAMM|nr:restriction endonuclease subunit S [Candidatus Thiothrix anitrata]QTR51301.1 restriction endonuclease subunit S [Candidatus Thiothrix anitrata]
MELKAGYKQTEVGVIPKDWEVEDFGFFYAEPSRNGIYKSAEYQGRGTRIVNMGEMFGFEFISDQEMSRIILTPKELTINRLIDGDLLFGRRSVVPSGAGKCSIVINPTETLTFESSIIRVRLDQSKAISLFFYYFFSSPIGRTVMGLIISGTNIKGIRGSELKTLKVFHPPKQEQTAIASALSDMDALLDGLDRLITKKRNLKQAAMQQLLTGKTRLAGFEGEWEVKRLGDLLTICHGKSQKDVETIDGAYPILATGGQIGTASLALYDQPSVLIGRKGTINQPQYMDTPFWTVDTLFYSILKNNNNAKFLYYRFCLIDWMQFNEASGVPSLNARTIESITIKTPLPEEQEAIAAVLSDMDAEIAALEQRHTKTRDIKQGMMQELLTGRTRLVAVNSAEAQPVSTTG